MERETYLFDAKGKVLGRLATEIATVLSGRDQVNFTPHIDGGGRVVVINANEVKVTGSKENDKVYYRFSGYHGGIKGVTVKEQREKDASKIIHSAVKGMMPKNKLANGMLKRLFVYNTDEHKHQISVDRSGN